MQTELKDYFSDRAYSAVSKLRGTQDFADLIKGQITRAERRFGPLGFEVSIETANGTDVPKTNPITVQVSRDQGQEVLYRIEVGMGVNTTSEDNFYTIKNSKGEEIWRERDTLDAVNEITSRLANRVPASQYVRERVIIQNGRLVVNDPK